MAQPERLPEAPTPVAPPEVTPWHEAPELNGISAVRLGQPQAPPAKRVRTSDAANDIENAFKAWEASVLHAAANEPSVSAAQAIIFAGDCGDARARVTTWLAQVTADQSQLHAALLACQAMAANSWYAPDRDELEKAVKLARAALETK